MEKGCSLMDLGLLEGAEGSLEAPEEKDLTLDQEHALVPYKKVSPEYFKGTSCMADYWSYAGMDSTTVYEVQNMDIENDEKENKEKVIFTEWEEFCQLPEVTLDEKIEKGIRHLRDLADGHNLLINQTQKELAKKAIWLGKYLNSLKDLVRKKKEEPWGSWAEKNIPFISMRNRQKYMKIAKREDCHKYCYLGVERLDLLCSATEDIKSSDPIGELFKSCQIDPISAETLPDFKDRVDTAITKKKLESKGLSFPYELIHDLTTQKVKFDKALIEKLTDIKESNGDPKKYLENLSMNGGKRSSEPDDKKRLQDFNTLANRLIKTIDYIKEKELVSKVDKDTFERLWTKMKELGEAANIVPKEVISA